MNRLRTALLGICLLLAYGSGLARVAHETTHTTHASHGAPASAAAAGITIGACGHRCHGEPTHRLADAPAPAPQDESDDHDSCALCVFLALAAPLPLGLDTPVPAPHGAAGTLELSAARAPARVVQRCGDARGPPRG